MYRQGDVLLIPTTSSIPSDSKEVPRDAGRIILADGEVTGHAHAIHNKAAVMYLLATGARMLSLQHEAMLQHEEHEKIVLPPGDYLVVRQREYSPEEIRNVAD